jgi:hypothetical protein
VIADAVRLASVLFVAATALFLVGLSVALTVIAR